MAGVVSCRQGFAPAPSLMAVAQHAGQLVVFEVLELAIGHRFETHAFTFLAVGDRSIAGGVQLADQGDSRHPGACRSRSFVRRFFELKNHSIILLFY
ncbi:MAG: hypothetical protein GQ559_10005, partial [Desulfobulbaceae bacterium]|nr:hypothetical protein [Desulfobulbaceae bacterium]